MKINKSLLVIAIAIFLTGGAQSEGVPADVAQQNGYKGIFSPLPKAQGQGQKEMLVDGIKFAAKETVSFYIDNYVVENIDISDLPQYFGPAFATFRNGGRLDRWIAMENAPFNNDLFVSNATMRTLATSVKLPAKIDDWFLPFDAKAQKFIQGDAAAGRDLFLRIFCLGVFQEGVTPIKNWSTYNSWSAARAEAYHYAATTRKLHFANQFAAEIARKMPKAYKNQVDFLSDFIIALSEIPNEKLYAMFDQARSETADAIENGFSVNIKDPDVQNWEAGLYEYSGSPEQGLTIKKSGQPIFGKGYIGGIFHEFVVASNSGVFEKTERSKIAK